MSQNLEVWQEGLKGVWLDPTKPAHYDNPELYDRPRDHGGIIHVMKGEYAFTSEESEFHQLGISLMGAFTFPLMIFEPETGVGFLGIPDDYINHLRMLDIIVEEIGKRRSPLICFDQRLDILFKHQLTKMAQFLQRSVKRKGVDVSLEEMEKRLRVLGPHFLFENVFPSVPRLIACDFTETSAFKIDLRRIIPDLDLIESGRDLISYLEEPPNSFMTGLLLGENVKQRMDLRQEMKEGRLKMPVCVYQPSNL